MLVTARIPQLASRSNCALLAQASHARARCDAKLSTIPQPRKECGKVQILSISSPKPFRFLLRPTNRGTFSTQAPRSEHEKKHEETIPADSFQSMPSPISWFSVLILAVVGGALVWLLYRETEKTKQLQNRSALGGPAIGGSWTLVDQDGQPRTEHDFQGKFQLLYFGFTHCPDVCPVEIQKMIEILNNLQAKDLGGELVPIFVTVDPKRDSVAQLRGYLAEFDRRFVGLTGTPDQVSKMAKAFRVYLSAGQVAEDEDDYLVDHSIFLYLMGPDNKFVEYYGVNLNSTDISKKVAAHIFAQKPSITRRVKSALGLG